MEGISLTYEAAMTGIGNYLSAKVEQKINNYQMKMLENNKIPGLLPTRGSMFNGAYRINYEIDGTRRLTAVLAGGGLRGQEARNFMADFLHTLSGLGEYFLSYMQCLLDTDYIYVDSRNRAKLVYLPLSGQIVTDEEKVRRFCLKLFAEHFTADGDPFFLNLLRYANMPDFSLAGLIAWFNGDEESAAADQEQGKQGLRAAQDGKNQPLNQILPGESKPQILQGFGNGQKPLQDSNVLAQGNSAPVQGKKSGLFRKNTKENGNDADPGFAVPGGGFAVPKSEEGKKKEEAKPEKEKKQSKEKGGSLFKALLSGKKEKAAEEKAAGDVELAQDSALRASGFPNKENRNEIKNIGNAGDENYSGDWHGTVMMNGENSTNTVVMGVSAAPYLLYQGMKISLEHFPFTLGKENTDFIIEKNVVSRMHASINYREEGYFVMDENSKNHTWLNGRQLSPYTEMPLQDGDTLRLANEIMTFHI